MVQARLGSGPPPVSEGQPLQLVRYDENGRLALGQEAVDVLRRIRAPIAVVAVAGRARTGKSYLLNQLLGAAGAGFEVASSYRPCTKGLWMWSHPIPRSAVDGSHYYLVLLDTEGIDAYNQTTQDGVALFSLAVLLSSMFVFNQMGGIDEAALDRLALVTELTRRIRVRSTTADAPGDGSGGGGGGSAAANGRSGSSGGGGSGGGSGGEGPSPAAGADGDAACTVRAAGGAGGPAGGVEGEAAGKAPAGEGKGWGKLLPKLPLAKGAANGANGQGVRAAPAGGVEGLEDPHALAEFTPSFMWLLRDFYYDLSDPETGAKQSARDYLETALMPTAGKGPAVEAKNAIRESIKALFPDRDCFTLVRPVTDEEELRGLDCLPHEQLRPEFKQGVARLTATLHARALPKRLGSQMLTGPLLAALAAAYVRTINAGAVPTIASAWHSVAEAECRSACHAAEDAYRAAFDPDVVPDEGALQAEHQRALAAASAAFKDRAVGDPALRRRYKERYVAACALAFDAVRARKMADAAEALEGQLAALAGRLHAEVRMRDASLERLARSLEAGVSGVVGATCGSARWPKLLQFCHTHYAALGAELLERQQAASELEAQRLQLAAQQAEAEAERLRNANKQLEAQLDAARRRAQEAAPWDSGSVSERSAYGGKGGHKRRSWLGCL